MILILGGLLADYTLRVSDISSRLKDLHHATFLELGPGGATNVAITLARFGLETGCMGEVGDDLFGRIILDSLEKEGVSTAYIAVTPGARTPVANVLVDERGEPAYLGYPGSLQLGRLLDTWREPLQSAEALFSDGWAEHDGAPAMILEAFRLAHKANVPVFFDPGPGNPRVDNDWHHEASSLATAVLATEEEARRLSGWDDPLASARTLLSKTTSLVAIKRGAAGCLLVTEEELEIAAGFPVTLRDATGAGDSFAGAVIYGLLRGLSLPELGALANATGAAKVEKPGTGHNMPTMGEVRAVLERFGQGKIGNLTLPKR